MFDLQLTEHETNKYEIEEVSLNKEIESRLHIWFQLGESE